MVDENLYKEGVSELRDSLIGRIIHVKEDKPLGHEVLVTRLGDLWNIRTPWTMIPIGEGYYSIQFSCDGYKERIFARRTWQLKPGVLRLQCWVPDFNPYRVTTSVVQTWILISELPLEYWNKHIITALASAVGIVIKIDDRTLGKMMGHFARVFVELDLKQEREEYLMFERAGHCSFVGIHYERFPDFCKFCNMIGHVTGHYGGHNTWKRQGKATTTSTSSLQKRDEPKVTTTGPVGGTKQWVQPTFPSAPVRGSARDQTTDKGNGTQTGVPCRNSFEVLEDLVGEEPRVVGSDFALENTDIIVESNDSMAGVVTLTLEDQLQIHLSHIEEDNVRPNVSPPPAGGVGMEDPPKGRKQKGLWWLRNIILGTDIVIRLIVMGLLPMGWG
ncbi:hypothetical protein ACS0TY_021421 [Phlomoides rotata]